MTRILCILTILASGAALWATDADDDPTTAVIAEHNDRIGRYMADYAKRAALARDGFERSVGASANLSIKKLEDLASRAIRAGDIKGAASAYRQVLRLDVTHKKARDYFQTLGQLDKVIAEVEADPLGVDAPTPRSSGDAATAWKELLRVDRTHAQARKHFADRGELRRVLKSLEPDIPQGAVQWNGNYYWLSKETTANRLHASLMCAKLGGRLARVDSRDKLDFLRTYIGKANPKGEVWIDGTDVINEGNWRFSDGSDMPFLDWTPGRPDGGRGKNFLVLRGDTGRRMADNTGEDRFVFLCEWEAIAPSRNEPSK